MIKIHANKYLTPLALTPDFRMYSQGWDHELHWFLWIFPYIIYTKEIR